MAHDNHRGLRTAALIVLGGAGAALAALGSLGRLVEAASLTFLLTFAGVNGIAIRESITRGWGPALGAVGAVATAIALAIRMCINSPISLVALGAVVAAALLLRRMLLDRRPPKAGDYF